MENTWFATVVARVGALVDETPSPRRGFLRRVGLVVAASLATLGLRPAAVEAGRKKHKKKKHKRKPAAPLKFTDFTGVWATTLETGATGELSATFYPSATHPQDEGRVSGTYSNNSGPGGAQRNGTFDFDADPDYFDDGQPSCTGTWTQTDGQSGLASMVLSDRNHWTGIYGIESENYTVAHTWSGVRIF